MHFQYLIWKLQWNLLIFVRILWFLQIVALLKSFGSRYTVRVPSVLGRYVSKLTQDVGSTCRVMISSTGFNFFALAFMMTRYLLCCTGGMLGQVWSIHLTYCLFCQRNLVTCSSGFISYGQFYSLWSSSRGQLLYGPEKGIQLSGGFEQGDSLCCGCVLGGFRSVSERRQSQRSQLHKLSWQLGQISHKEMHIEILCKVDKFILTKLFSLYQFIWKNARMFITRVIV